MRSLNLLTHSLWQTLMSVTNLIDNILFTNHTSEAVRHHNFCFKRAAIFLGSIGFYSRDPYKIVLYASNPSQRKPVIVLSYGLALFHK